MIASNNQNSKVAPYFLATNRGFYQGAVKFKDANRETLLFTANIRKATAFNSFNEAEVVFASLLAASKDCNCKIAEYCAIVTTANVARTSTKEAPHDNDYS